MSDRDAGPDITIASCTIRHSEGSDSIANGQDTISLAEIIERFHLPAEFAERIELVMEGDCKVVLNADTDCDNAQNAIAAGEHFDPTGGVMVRGITFVIRGSVTAVVQNLDKMTVSDTTGPCGTYSRDSVALFEEGGPQVTPEQQAVNPGIDQASIINVSNLHGDNTVIRVYAEQDRATVHTRTYSAKPLEQGQIGDFDVHSLTEVSVRYTDEGETLDNDAGAGRDAGMDAGVADRRITSSSIGHADRRHSKPDTGCNIAGPVDVTGLVVMLVAGRVIQVIGGRKR